MSKSVKQILQDYDHLKAESGAQLNKKAHLMTLEEYQSLVASIITEFRKFLRKNKYFVNMAYSGYELYSYPELVDAMEAGKGVGYRFDFDKPDKYGRTKEQKLQEGWKEQTRGQEIEKEVPQAIIDQKNEYINKLTSIFGEAFMKYGIGESDIIKSNKRAVRYALDNDVYGKMIYDGEITIQELQPIFESVGVRMPKKLTDKDSYAKSVLNAELYDKIPLANREKLKSLLLDIDNTLQPYYKELYQKEWDRVLKNISELQSEKEFSDDKLVRMIDYNEIVEPIGKFVREIDAVDRYGRPQKQPITFYTALIYLSGWEAKLDAGVTRYVETLKQSLYHSILDHFRKIHNAIREWKKISLRVGTKGIQGSFLFKFENGGSFVFETEAIGAGGYNIQCYHFRYLSHFKDVVPPAGKESGNSKLSIAQIFSDEDDTKGVTDPFFAVEKATSVEDIIKSVYNIFKGSWYAKNVRLNEKEMYFTFKPHNSNRMFGDYFSLGKTTTLDEAKALAIQKLKKLQEKNNIPVKF
jgi:hypothetical protein